MSRAVYYQMVPSLKTSGSMNSLSHSQQNMVEKGRQRAHKV